MNADALTTGLIGIVILGTMAVIGFVWLVFPFVLYGKINHLTRQIERVAQAAERQVFYTEQSISAESPRTQQQIEA